MGKVTRTGTYCTEDGVESGTVTYDAEVIRQDRLNFPHDEDCPNCGRRQWTSEAEQNTCQACGTRICELCGADFGEDYDSACTRLTDNLGAHVAQWHA